MEPDDIKEMITTMKNDWEIYRDTGMLGAYDKDNAVLRQAESGGVETVFEDTESRVEDDALVRERIMLVGGKSFRVTSVFPGDGKATPTEKLLQYIDSELEKEAHSA